MKGLQEPQDNPNGLHRRYVVTKTNGEPVDPDAVYFVLRLDSNGRDRMHVTACRAGAMAYVKKIQEMGLAAEHLQQVAIDLEAVLKFIEHFGL